MSRKFRPGPLHPLCPVTILLWISTTCGLCFNMSFKWQICGESTMTHPFKQAQILSEKLNPSQEDRREIVRLRLEAAEQGTGLSLIEIADCYQWSGRDMLKHFDDKSPATYATALRTLEILDNMDGLPDWYEKYDILIMARIAPASFGYDPTAVESSEALIVDRLVEKLVDAKGPLETVNCLPNCLYQSVFEPVESGRAVSVTENVSAINALLQIVSRVKIVLPELPMGEVGYTCRGLLYHYCRPRDRTSFEVAKESYKSAIRKLSLVEFGASCAYTHLIDLLERPAVHGFKDDCVDEFSTMEEALQLRRVREEWYRTDPSRRALLWEIQMLVNHHWSSCSFNLRNPPVEAIKRAVYLGQKVLAESDNNLIKQLTAALLGWIYHYRASSTVQNVRTAFKYYRQAFTINPDADGSIKTDFTFVGMSVDDRVRANTYRSEATLRGILQIVLPLCFLPQSDFALPPADLDDFKQFLTTLSTTVPGNKASKLLSKCLPEYAAFANEYCARMAESPATLQKDKFVQCKAEQVGSVIVGGNGAAKVTAIKEELQTTKQIIGSFYRDPVMTQFYVGFSTTFSEIHGASRAIRSGNVATSTGNTAVSAASFLLSMAPIVGGAASAALNAGYSFYAETKLRNNAGMMMTTFPLDAALCDAVLEVLQRVHRDRLQELKELDATSDQIKVTLLDALSERLEYLTSLIAKQSAETYVQKLAARLAMNLIEQQIYTGAIPPLLPPDDTAAHLAQQTLVLITDTHTVRDAASAKKFAKSPRTPGTAPSSPMSPDLGVAVSTTPTCTRPCVVS